MEKKKIVFWICLFVLPICLSAQDNILIRKGLLSGRLTIAPSKMLDNNSSPFYAHASIEAFLQDRVSFIGEGFYYLGENSESKTFDYNHNLLFGLAWHFTRKNNDLFFALQPGLSFTRLNEAESVLMKTHLGVNPVISPTIGYNFYLSKYFHFFVQTRFIVGAHKYDVYRSLNEFRFSAGLGFNINTLK